MKGISVFTAIALISVVTDIRRFANSKKCASYLSRWLLQKDLTQEAVHYVNSQVDEYSEKERELQEKVWEIEDKISAFELQNYNVSGICDLLKDFTVTFHGLHNGERKLLVESIVHKVVIGQNKKVTLVLRPPLEHLGFLSPSIALRGEKPKMEFTIYLEYSLMDYYGGTAGRLRVFTQYSKQEYSI